MPRVDRAFVEQALGAGLALANTPLVEEMDHREGAEALVATHRGGRQFQVAVVRGNLEVLARAPLGGKVLAHANVRAVGAFKSMDLFDDGTRVHLLPVETEVVKRPVCGILALRYRRDTLSLIGEFGCKCWRRSAGGDDVDPFGYFKVLRDGKQLRIETVELVGKSHYRWDEAQQAFLALLSPPGK